MLRVAREVLAVLPVKELLLQAQIPLSSNDDAPDELSPVYSVRLNRGGLAGLDFDKLDPSDTIESFPHEGDFKASRKAGAFQAIVPMTFDFSEPLGSRPTISELRTKVAEFRERFSELVPAD
jgi:hypothetical protein